MQFNSIIGQNELKQHLISEVNSGKISHAQLFLGKAGHGSLPLALSFVTYIFCEQKRESDSCGTCDSCRKMQSLQHPDLHFSFPTVQAISKKSDGLLAEWRQQLHNTPWFNLNDWTKFIDPKERKPIIGTEESAEILRKLSLKSYEGGYKVMIIWMAEEMNAACSNKLLKILEEPPAKTLFILLAESQDLMLTTILSRTQLVKVRPLEMDVIQKTLMERGANAATASSIAARSEGNLRDALSEFMENDENDHHRDLFIQLMRVCFKKDVSLMLDWTDNIVQLSREGQKIFLKYALHMVRQSMLRNYTNGTLTRVSDEEEAFLKNFSRFITNNNLLEFSQLLNDAHYHIERNAHAKLLFTQLCFQVMRFIHRA